jgi:6-pyruvoyltetrahydropterin/6-carboxytetrahydropterin synthase
MTTQTIVTEIFSSAHFYHQKNWSAEENLQHFGRCFTQYGHGHNYRLEVAFQNPQTPLMELKAHVKKVTDPLDHQHLNFVIAEFQTEIPTTENIAKYLLKKLHEACPRERISYIKLFEMDDLWVEIRG